MGRIVIAVDDRGRRYKVTEEQAAKRGYQVLGKTSTSDSTRTKSESKPKSTTKKTAARRKKA